MGNNYSKETFRTYSLISNAGSEPSVIRRPLTVKFTIVTPSIVCSAWRPRIQLRVDCVPKQEISRNPLLPRRSTTSCKPILELPLESTSDGIARLCHNSTKPPRITRIWHRMERTDFRRLRRSEYERLFCSR